MARCVIDGKSGTAMSTRSFDLLRWLVVLLGTSVVAAVPTQAQQSNTAPLDRAQLEQLVAPIALHPDSLLSQVLMASTYPTEVVEAARWARNNPDVSGQALQDAMQKQTWDPSVKALTAVPQALQMMSDKLGWTQSLGDAFLSQQKDVLAAVQRLRQRAEVSGHLKTTEQQTVSKAAAPAASGKTSVIAIESANPELLYVPVYDPRVCYGVWPYQGYEPFYWYPSGFVSGNAFSFAAGVAVGAAIWGHVDWWRGRVDIDVNRFNQFNHTNIVNNAWHHDPLHRGNVPYRDAKVAQQFGQANRAGAREAFRGKAEAGRRDLAKARADKSGRDARSKLAGKANPAARTGQAAMSGKATRTRQAARSRQVSRPRAAAHRPRAGGNAAVRGMRGHAFRPAGGVRRAGLRGGGRGGGIRRGRR